MMTCVPARLGARSNTLAGGASPSVGQWNAALAVTIAMLDADVHVQKATA